MVFLVGEFGSNIRLTFCRNLTAGLEMPSGKLWREARAITRRRKILVGALKQFHILLRLTAFIGMYLGVHSKVHALPVAFFRSMLR